MVVRMLADGPAKNLDSFVVWNPMAATPTPDPWSSTPAGPYFEVDLNYDTVAYGGVVSSAVACAADNGIGVIGLSGADGGSGAVAIVDVSERR